MLVPHSDFPEGPQPMEGEILCPVFVFLRKLDGNWRKIEGFVFFFFLFSSVSALILEES